MLTNKLKLNDDKTEVIICNPKSFEMEIDQISFGTFRIKFSDTTKNLGVVLDSRLSMISHINNLCKGIYLETHRIRHMSHFLDAST